MNGWAEKLGSRMRKTCLTVAKHRRVTSTIRITFIQEELLNKINQLHTEHRDVSNNCLYLLRLQFVQQVIAFFLELLDHVTHLFLMIDVYLAALGIGIVLRVAIDSPGLLFLGLLPLVVELVETLFQLNKQ